MHRHAQIRVPIRFHKEKTGNTYKQIYTYANPWFLLLFYTKTFCNAWGILFAYDAMAVELMTYVFNVSVPDEGSLEESYPNMMLVTSLRTKL
jgi:hypothetical protein